MKKILFMGDSITDCNRGKGPSERDPILNLGNGYAGFIAGRMGLEHPGEYEFVNRGISGNRIVDVYARTVRDIISLKPDYMSILIGINDVWHTVFDPEHPHGVDGRKFLKVYDLLIEELKEELPDLKIMLMEPFVLEGPATAERIEWFEEETAIRAQAVREIAAKHDLPLIPLQADLLELCEKAPETYWLADGVHPCAPFHQYIADKWMAAFKKYCLNED